jgi:Domain of unknown function (DUF4397)
MRRMSLAFGGLLAAAATTVAIAPAAAAQETGSVYVVHGVPNTPVDVYVDGARALDDFAPGTSAGPVDLPAGARDVAIFPADAADGSGSPLLSASPQLPAGGNVTLVAHLDAGGKPTVTPFVNDVSSVPAGQARVVLRHTAAAPAVDVLAGGSPVVNGLTNPERGVPGGARGHDPSRGRGGRDHRPGDRPGRPGPAGGYGDLRACDRLAAGQHPWPGGCHRRRAAQRAVRRPLRRAVRRPARALTCLAPRWAGWSPASC